MNLTQNPIVVSVLAAVLTFAMSVSPAQAPRLASNEFVFERAPFASSHASTIVEIPNGLLVAWFGGTRESAPDVGIWVARYTGTQWEAVQKVTACAGVDGAPQPCWNPVLVVNAGVVHLFYKAGPNPREWWGVERQSTDNGRTWSAERRLPAGILGPIKNKPLILPSGAWLSGSSTEAIGDGSGPWRVHFERSTDAGRTWTRIEPAANDKSVDAIQPALLLHPGGKIQAIGRTRQQKLFSTWSSDDGRSWSALSLLDVPNPNAGIDAVSLKDGRYLMVYNPVLDARTPLSVALSDDGETWHRLLDLETAAGEYSYPAVIQTADGRVHITYTWRRERIKHAVVELRPR